MSLTPPVSSSPQVQEKGTYDLLAPLALLFYSTVLCVSSRMGQAGGGRRGEARMTAMGGIAFTPLEIDTEKETGKH